MTMNKEKKRVPELRFAGFEGEWEKSLLGERCLKIGDGLHGTPKYVDDSDIYFINGNNIVSGKVEIYDNTKQVSEDTYIKNRKEINKNTLLISINGTIGNIGRYNNELVMLGKSVAYLTFHDKPSFEFHYLNTSKAQQFFVSQLTGTTIKNLSLKTLRETSIYMPQIEEQQKIASFLTSIDTRIQQLEKKRTLLEQYKKGVMQHIFKQEIRFKNDDGEEFPKWEEKRLGEIGFFKTSSVNKLSYKNDKEVFLVNYMNVYRHEKIDNISVKEFQVVTANENQLNSTNLLEGDILFTPSSETPSDIGHSVVISEDIDNAVYSYHLMRFRPNIKIDILYSHYFCNIPSVLKQFSKFATGSTRYTISVSSFSKVKVQLPSIQEQTKIAHFLSAIDKKIAVVEEQIEGAKQWKKGLLQRMFV